MAEVPQDIATQLVDPSRRQGVLRALRERYRAGTKAEKGRFLDEVVALTGYHRKHLVRLLRGSARTTRPKFYDDAVQRALEVAWKASGRVCGKRLKALLPGLVSTLERDGRLPRDLVLRGKLLHISAATIDRLLRPVRAKSAMTSVEQRLDNIRQSISEFTHFTIPANISPDERRRLELQYQRIVNELRQYAADKG